MAETWTDANPYWQVMTPYQRAAAMSIMETGDTNDATNVIGAMVNRARADKADLGAQVGTKVYQPSIEPTQEARLDKIIRTQQFHDLSKKAEDYWVGKEEVPHKATHFLAPEQVMLSLESKDPQKYKSWRNWTGYNPESGEYSNVAFRDKSHAFIIPGDQKALTYTPIEHDPFRAAPGDVVAPGRPKVYIGDSLPDVGSPALGDGGQFSPGTRMGNRLAGLNGEERFQTWPERMVRSGTTIAGDAVTGQDVSGIANMGLRREDVTDLPYPSGLTVSAQPGDVVRERAGDMAGLLGLSGIKGTPPGASLGAAGSRLAPFYSAAEAAVNAAPMKSAPAADWSGWLKNQQHIKPDEMKWHGIDDFLKARELEGKPVTQEELAKHIGENRLQLTERQLTSDPTEMRAAMKSVLEFHGKDLSKYPDKRLDGMIRHAFEYGSRDAIGGPMVDSRIYDQFVELVHDNKLDKDHVRYGSDSYDNLVSPGGKPESYRESILHLPKTAKQYTSGHWDEINPILHVRHDEIFQPDPKGPSIGPNGENGYRTLRIMEMQSDKSARLRQLKKELKSLEDGTYEHHPGNFDDPPTIPETKAEIEALGKLPYNSTNAWTELGIKHMIKKAADEGFDRLAWEPGHIQHTRYGGDEVMGRGTGTGEIHHLQYNRHGDTVTLNYLLDPMPANSRRHWFEDDVKTLTIDKSKLSDILGKDVAQKILDSKEMKEITKAEINWDNIPISNEHEGLKRLYDEVLPITANKVLKKFGDTQVVKTTHDYHPKKNDPENFGEKKPPVDLHTIDLTPKLREVATQRGFPLFMKGIPFPLEPVDHDPYKHTPVESNPFQ